MMHIEKNVCDKIIGTLLNISGEKKDGIKSRLDLMKMGIQKELKPVKKGHRMYLPPASYMVSQKEKIILCEFISKVKVLEGYSSNFKILISLEDLKLAGLKSHDFHILIQYLSSVALCGVLPNKVCYLVSLFQNIMQ